MHHRSLSNTRAHPSRASSPPCLPDYALPTGFMAMAASPSAPPKGGCTGASCVPDRLPDRAQRLHQPRRRRRHGEPLFRPRAHCPLRSPLSAPLLISSAAAPGAQVGDSRAGGCSGAPGPACNPPARRALRRAYRCAKPIGAGQLNPPSPRPL
jgi:hypothetical protein